MSTTVISSGTSFDLTAPLLPLDALSFSGAGTLTIETTAVESHVLYPDGQTVTSAGIGGYVENFGTADTILLKDIATIIPQFDGDSSSSAASTFSLLLSNIGGIDSSVGLEVLTVSPSGQVSDATGLVEGTFFGQAAPQFLVEDLTSFALSVDRGLFGGESQASDLYITLAPDASNSKIADATITSSGPMNSAVINTGGTYDLTTTLSGGMPIEFANGSGDSGLLVVETTAVETYPVTAGSSAGIGGYVEGFTTGDTILLKDLATVIPSFDGDSSSSAASTFSLLLGNIGGIDSSVGLEVLTVSPSGQVSDATGLVEGTFFGQAAPQFLVDDLTSFALSVENAFFGNAAQTSDLYITLAPDASNSKLADATITSSGPMVVCYLRGTQILTPTGERPIEELKAGDLVATHSGGMRPVKWIGVQSFGARFVARNYDRLPVKIAAGALGDGMPRRDLSVSPGHSLFLDGQLILARDLVNGVTITQPERSEDTHYYLLELDTHDCVIAEGTWAESFADGPGLRNQFHNVSEYRTRFPEYAEPDELTLYAPRPQVGPDLEVRLARVLARTGYTPAKVQGYVEQVTDKVEGWACDAANPFYPVTVAIFAGEEKLAEVMAHQHRVDLAAAGFGAGRHMFSYDLPADLSAAARASVRVVCVADGTELPYTKDAVVKAA